MYRLLKSLLGRCSHWLGVFGWDSVKHSSWYSSSNQVDWDGVVYSGVLWWSSMRDFKGVSLTDFRTGWIAISVLVPSISYSPCCFPFCFSLILIHFMGKNIACINYNKFNK